LHDVNLWTSMNRFIVKIVIGASVRAVQIAIIAFSHSGVCGPVSSTVCMCAAAVAEHWNSQRTRILVTDERFRMSVRASSQQRRTLLNYNSLCLFFVYPLNVI
jgi:hypothetical protein